VEVIVTSESRIAALDAFAWRIAPRDGSLSRATSYDFANRVIDHADDSGELGYTLMDFGAAAAREYRSESGVMALSAVLLRRADDESRSVEERQAARLILAHAAINLDANFGDECCCSETDVIADRGVADYESACNTVNNLDRVNATLIAICDLWLDLLPELVVLGVDVLGTLLPAVSEFDC
jgi:hypothetical protein